jgi:hypothetical protein
MCTQWSGYGAAMERLWSGALKILDREDRDWKQMLLRDLDDDSFHGREHIHTLLSMVSHTHRCTKFVDLARPFLLVITHLALLDCLLINTFVGTCTTTSVAAMGIEQSLSLSVSPQTCLTSLAQKVCVFSDLFRPCNTKVNELNRMLFNNYIKTCVRYYKHSNKRSRILISR